MFSLFFIIILLTFQDYGITYDEFWRNDYGSAILRWFRSGFQDTYALTTFDYQYYGSFFTTVQQFFSNILPFGIYETNHLINALCSLLTLVIVYKLGKFLGNPFVGFLSAFMLLFNPRYYGHSFNNPVDLPLATFYVLSIYLIVSLLDTLPATPKRQIILLGITIGLSLATRLSSLIIFIYIAAAFSLWFLNKLILTPGDGPQEENTSRMIYKFVMWGFVIGIVAYVAMILFWPAAQVNPLRQPIRALRHFFNLENPFPVFFNGSEILNNELPWFYQIYWFLITSPEFMFVSIIIGLIILIVNFKSIWANKSSSKSMGLTILLLSIAIPFAYTIIQTPTDYDGIRHFLFLIPLLSIVAAMSVGKLLESNNIMWLKIGVLAIIAISMTVTFVDIAKLHPNQYIYFNRIFGKGVAQASQNFDTDYWGNSYKEATEWLQNNYMVSPGSPKVKVASCLFSLSTSYYLRDDQFEYIGSYHDGQRVTETPDIFLATRRWNCDETLNGEVIYEISRMGASLVQIKKVTP